MPVTMNQLAALGLRFTAGQDALQGQKLRAERNQRDAERLAMSKQAVAYNMQQDRERVNRENERFEYNKGIDVRNFKMDQKRDARAQEKLAWEREAIKSSERIKKGAMKWLENPNTDLSDLEDHERFDAIVSGAKVKNEQDENARRRIRDHFVLSQQRISELGTKAAIAVRRLGIENAVPQLREFYKHAQDGNIGYENNGDGTAIIIPRDGQPFNSGKLTVEGVLNDIATAQNPKVHIPLKIKEIQKRRKLNQEAMSNREHYQASDGTILTVTQPMRNPLADASDTQIFRKYYRYNATGGDEISEQDFINMRPKRILRTPKEKANFVNVNGEILERKAVIEEIKLLGQQLKKGGATNDLMNSIATILVRNNDGTSDIDLGNMGASGKQSLLDQIDAAKSSPKKLVRVAAERFDLLLKAFLGEDKKLTRGIGPESTGKTVSGNWKDYTSDSLRGGAF